MPLDRSIVQMTPESSPAIDWSGQITDRLLVNLRVLPRRHAEEERGDIRANLVHLVTDIH